MACGFVARKATRSELEAKRVRATRACVRDLASCGARSDLLETRGDAPCEGARWSRDDFAKSTSMIAATISHLLRRVPAQLAAILFAVVVQLGASQRVAAAA